LEEARAFARLREAGRSQRDIAGRLGCAQSQVSKRLALLDLPQEAQTAVEAGRLQLADAAELLKLRGHPERLAVVLDYALDDRFPAVDVPGRVGSELWQVERAEQLRRRLAPAAERGARLLNTDAGELPRDFMRRVIGEPARIDAAAAAGTLAAYLTGAGGICYLDLADPLPDGAPDPGLVTGEDSDDGPEAVSSGGITVRRSDPAPATPDGPGPGDMRAVVDDAWAAAAAGRVELQAAEEARDAVCQRIVAGFAADPSTALPFLAGQVLLDAGGYAMRGDGWYIDPERAGAWLAGTDLAGDVGDLDVCEPDVYAWLAHAADPRVRVATAGALALAGSERRLVANAGYGEWDAHDLAHLHRLVTAGHELADVERRLADAAGTTDSHPGGER
jgi:hypothetical protein